MGAPDDALLQETIEGDRDALGALLEQHGPAVRGALAGKIPKRWQSLLAEDDVMQQTYADAFLDISKLAARDERSFVAWLTMAAKRNLLDAIKMLEADRRGGDWRRVDPARGDESFVALYDLLADGGTTPSRHAARSELKLMLQRAIAQLPGAYGPVVRMYDLEGRPVQEVAAALGRSPGAVFMLRARAHRCLRGILGAASDFLSGSA